MRRDALRLEPDNKFFISCVGVVGYSFQTVREALGVHLPGARIGPFSVVRIPACINPPIVDFDSFFTVAPDEFFLVLFVVSDERTEVGATASGKERGREQSSGPGHYMRDQPSPPEILRTNPIAFVELNLD